MKVKDLIDELKRLNANANITINGRIVIAIAEVNGKVGDGVRYANDEFRKHKDGRDIGVEFLVHTEFSDGTIGLTSVHT